MTTLLQFEHVDKRYRIGASRGSLRDGVTGLARSLVGKNGTHADDAIWALKDVNFTANTGDVIGIIGHNGAGKTTLLKLLSGVTQPTSGTVHVRGRVSALIELGAGFHPDLTGRENIYLNGVILGLSRRQIDKRFDSIVEFAELHRFIDTPVKRYSSGMYARLGFAVAAHTDPDLLVVDEVLGVGDQNFQQKCHDFIQSFVVGPKSALFVSHNLYVIEELCNRLIWLDQGHIVMTGSPGEVLPKYFDYIEENALRRRVADGIEGGKDLSITSVRLTDEAGTERDTFAKGESIVVNIAYDAMARIELPHFCLAVTASGGGQLLFGANMLVDGRAPEQISGEGIMRCTFESVPLMPRVYELWGEVWYSDRQRLLVDWQRLGSFRIADPVRLASAGASIRHIRADAPIQVPYRWDGASEPSAVGGSRMWASTCTQATASARPAMTQERSAGSSSSPDSEAR